MQTRDLILCCELPITKVILKKILGSPLIPQQIEWEKFTKCMEELINL